MNKDALQLIQSNVAYTQKNFKRAAAKRREKAVHKDGSIFFKLFTQTCL